MTNWRTHRWLKLLFPTDKDFTIISVNFTHDQTYDHKTGSAALTWLVNSQYDSSILQRHITQSKILHHNKFHTLLSHVSSPVSWWVSTHLPDSPGPPRTDSLTGAGHGGTGWWRRQDACCLTWWRRLRPLCGHWGSETLQVTATGREVAGWLLSC